MLKYNNFDIPRDRIIQSLHYLQGQHSTMFTSPILCQNEI